MTATRRLPGISIDVTPPPSREVMPRMDVAVFVGFTSSGPLHRPVAVENVAQFDAVFGTDAPLAWDAARSERVYANLGPAVRAFFSNGGLRCWVIRVARTVALEALWRGIDQGAVGPGDIAAANEFALPGVLALSGGGSSSPLATFAPALVQARSLGAWSDDLRVATALSATGFLLDAWHPLKSSGTQPRVRFGTRTRLRVGDLVLIGDPTTEFGPRIFAHIDNVFTEPESTTSREQVEATICASFERLGDDLLAAPTDLAGTAEVIGVTSVPVAATLQIRPGATPSTRLCFNVPLPATLSESSWARWSDGSRTAWLRMDRIARTPSASDATRVDASADGPCWQEMPMLQSPPAPSPTRASVLTLELQVSDGQGAHWHQSGIGLAPDHPAAWWQQTSDDVYYESAPIVESGERFPLAARDAEQDSAAPFAFIPLGVEALFGAAVSPVSQSCSALERDGLSRFDAELFLDPELAAQRTASLLEEADRIRYLRDRPRPLFGVHGALSIGSQGIFNEASLIALPDALHLGWAPRDYAHPAPAKPEKATAPGHWFTHRGGCTPPDRPSDTTHPDFGNFLDCGTHALAAPLLIGPLGTVQVSTFRLTWSASEPGAEYVLREATQTDLLDAREIYRGSTRQFDVQAPREGIFYYVITARLGDEISNDSNAVAIAVRNDSWELASPKDYAAEGEANLLKVHRCVLRLAAASGELFAVFGLPCHYRAPEARRYAMRLRSGQASGSDTGAFGFDETRALSFGALYHPWVDFGMAAVPTNASVATSNDLASAHTRRRVGPPDGIATGVLAARSSNRGAWIAPANEVFKDVVALTPTIEADAWLDLQNAQINVVRADPRGFLTLSADTLANDFELRPINVRRLLILLRRLALQRGVNYVFEPNGDALRRSVNRAFTVLLDNLFRRGAFAGATASESFKVITDDSLNTSAARDTGRFLVELRVAPAMPLQFLTLRLDQVGERFTLAEAF